MGIMDMSKKEELIRKYANELTEKCGVTPDMDLLNQVTTWCGPSIYNRDSSTVSGQSMSELSTVKNSFLIGKLGLPEGPELDEALEKTIEIYGRSNPMKYRAVLYYLLTVHFNKQEMAKAKMATA